MPEDVAVFECDFGYALKGSQKSQCQFEGTWDPPVPTCEKMVKCRPPPSIINGEHGNFSDTFGVGAIVHYHCKPGFILIGNESIQCTMHGVWSHPLPQCEAGCVSPGIGHGKAIGRESLYMPGDIITIECNTDNSSKVLHKSQCRSEGTWFPPLPACDGVLHCSKPPDILHGSHSGLGKAVFTPGTSVNYSCETGFSLIGMTSIYCTESGAWSHPPPVCKVVKCLHPPAVTNGKLQGNTSDTYFYGASLSYSCDSGYSLIGDAFITCTASGTWSHPPPQCKEISCVFPEVQGVKKSTPGKTYRFGTNITLECDDGYTLEGLNQIQCQEDFSWDPPVPACKLTSPRSGSVGLGIAAAVVLLLLGVTIGWKIISKQKEGYYRTYENYNYKTSLD
uniref:Sushi domain-containing protein n=1 Tax=Coturnix japonica TaxID=93934 RepID=A0A8C2TWR3_COTJA